MRPSRLIATFGGVGLIRPAPGTWGTLAGLAFVPLLQALPAWGYLAAIVLGALFGCWLCGKVSRDLGVHDHGGIVWDEVAAFLLVLPFTPASPFGFLLAFALFRLFDIWKPFPWRGLQHLPGGWGIVVDDLGAGLYANLILQAAALGFSLVV